MPRPPPRFARPPPKLAPLDRAARWRLGLGLVALALLLPVQVVLADRVRLAANPDWRPLLEMVCARLGCTLPAWREPAAFVVLSREIQPHPSSPQALLVTASFRNEARWPQAWPVLELVLSDLDGQAIGLRRFQPVEYLGGTPSRPSLAPGQSASLALEIVDPGHRAVSFEFDFH